MIILNSLENLSYLDGKQILQHPLMKILFALLFITSLHAEMKEMLIPHPLNSEKKIEGIWHPLAWKAPLLLLLHGTTFKNGAREFASDNINFWNEKGFAIAAVSLPGFGLSDGPFDFCGQNTQDAIKEALRFLKTQDFVDATPTTIIGFGIGGLSAVLLAAEESDLSCVVCVNAGFDQRRHLDPNDRLYQFWEAHHCFEINDEEINKRSPLLFTDKISIPLLIFHHLDSQLITVDEVENFCKAVKNCRLKFTSAGSERAVPQREIRQEIYLFLQGVIGNLPSAEK